MVSCSEPVTTHHPLLHCTSLHTPPLLYTPALHTVVWHTVLHTMRSSMTFKSYGNEDLKSQAPSDCKVHKHEFRTPRCTRSHLVSILLELHTKAVHPAPKAVERSL